MQCRIVEKQRENEYPDYINIEHYYFQIEFIAFGLCLLGRYNTGIIPHLIR